MDIATGFPDDEQEPDFSSMSAEEIIAYQKRKDEEDRARKQADVEESFSALDPTDVTSPNSTNLPTNRTLFQMLSELVQLLKEILTTCKDKKRLSYVESTLLIYAERWLSQVDEERDWNERL